MSAACVRLWLSRTVTAVCGGRPGYWTPASRFTICSEIAKITASSWRRSPFCTAAVDTEKTPAPKKQKRDPQANGTLGSVGRKIPQRQIHLINDTGESLGHVHRADVLRIMDEKGLKLVLLNEHQDPPVYQLMTGKQIHEEQLKQREKKKAKAATVQVKELVFSLGIGAHDLTTKLKQAEGWLEKKHHIKFTLRSEKNSPAVNLETTLEQMMQQMGVTVAFVSKPKVIRDGKAAMCVIRRPSAKELSQKTKNKAAASKPDDSKPEATQNKASPVSSTDTTEGSKPE